MFSWHALNLHCGCQSRYVHYFFFICQRVFADPDTSPVLKMEFVGSWKSQIKEVTVSQRVIIDCNYLAINMLVTLQKREHYMNMCITNSPSSILYEGCGQGGVHMPVPTVLGKQSWEFPGLRSSRATWATYPDLSEKRKGEHVSLNRGLSLSPWWD